MEIPHFVRDDNFKKDDSLKRDDKLKEEAVGKRYLIFSTILP